MTSDRQKCLDAGCNDYLSKPINKAKLIQTVAQYCGKETFREQKSVDSAQKPSTDTPQLIEEFVAGLQEKLQSMKDALANGNFETLERLADQLKGTGGSCGYSALTEAARPLEDAAKAQDSGNPGLQSEMEIKVEF